MSDSVSAAGGWGAARAACKMRALSKRQGSIADSEVAALEELAEAARLEEEEDLRALREEHEKEEARAEQEALLAKLEASRRVRVDGDRANGNMIESLREEVAHQAVELDTMQLRHELVGEAARSIAVKMMSVRETMSSLKMAKARLLATFSEARKIAENTHFAANGVTEMMAQQIRDLARLETEKTELTLDLELAVVERDTLKESVEQLEGKVEEGEEQRKSLEGTLQEVKSSTSNMRTEMEELREERDAVAAQCDTLMQQTFTIQREKAAVQESLNDLKRRTATIVEDNAFLSADRNRLQTELDHSVTAHQTEMDAIKTDHTKRLDKEKKKVKVLEASLTAALEKASKAERLAEDRSKTALQLLRGQKMASAISTTIRQLREAPLPPAVQEKKPAGNYQIPLVVERMNARRGEWQKQWQRRRDDFVGSREQALCKGEGVLLMSPEACGTVCPSPTNTRPLSAIPHTKDYTDVVKRPRVFAVATKARIG